jgi:hypothetical protein
VTKDQAIGVVETASQKIAGQPWISSEAATALTRSLASLSTLHGGVGEKIRSATHWIDIYASDRKSEARGGRPMIQTHILADLSAARQLIGRLPDAGGFL